ncbi:DUF2971 domain-containing protein [Bradyrhizobium sp. SSUT18]|uniref:DUF2971 domain-containing protein n=1 Tax=Bradyrhizobium sp. SSUT18 TaxID=3040602 RepID=UPI002446A8A0|nr:DUF2971 domain-containing protein [Bradyrhizobium sp. SSUT18]MDH2404280.1 DUF2971 domain-containing protein [Bradyrhizobium sp. SSUT18]
MTRPDHWKHDRNYFYKYMTCDTADAVLRNRSLKWSPASAFNDPFDMQFDLHLDFDEESLVRKCGRDFKEIIFGGRDFNPSVGLGNVLSRLQVIGPRMPTIELDSYIEMAIRMAIKSVAPDMKSMHTDLRNHFGRYKVLCLSERNDSILMWSHYAANHTGIAIRLACLEETDSSWAVAQPIKYCERMPRFVDEEELRALISGQAELRREAIVERTIFTKAEDWRYEREWRVYRPSEHTAAEYLEFNPPELSAIYFGCRTPEEAREKISALALTINPDVQLFSAFKSEREFALELEQIN